MFDLTPNANPEDPATGSAAGPFAVYASHYQLSSAESRPASVLSSLILCLWNNRGPMCCNHPNASDHFIPKLAHPGTLSLYARGALAEVRTFEKTLLHQSQSTSPS
jgi:hypothetical protein